MPLQKQSTILFLEYSIFIVGLLYSAIANPVLYVNSYLIFLLVQWTKL